MNEEWRAVVEFAFDRILLLVICYTLLLKALNIRRMSRLGAAIAANNVVFAILYLGGALAVWVGAFTSQPWRYGIRLAVLVTVLMVLFELKHAFGGWLELHKRAWASLADLLRWPGRSGEA